MTMSDEEAELALQRLVAQAGVWSAAAPGGESAVGTDMDDEHPLETLLLRWWGRLRFPDAEYPEVPPQGRSERSGVWPRGWSGGGLGAGRGNGSALDALWLMAGV
ncbi:hypothetical protein EDD99_6675 [Streptomyces sp. 846.5]|nr:hypothetical protein [Streptomyces sp. 846.5]TDT98448.1 hypothetical protein EDD99_6675 [Streptomyces sp. 846.5]